MSQYAMTAHLYCVSEACKMDESCNEVNSSWFECFEPVSQSRVKIYWIWLLGVVSCERGLMMAGCQFDLQFQILAYISQLTMTAPAISPVTQGSPVMGTPGLGLS